MPKVKKTATEERNAEYRARLIYLMNVKEYDNAKLAKLLGISVSGLVAKKKNFGLFRMEEIWAMEKAFHCPLSEPIRIQDARGLVG